MFGMKTNGTGEEVQRMPLQLMRGKRLNKRVAVNISQASFMLSALPGGGTL